MDMGFLLFLQELRESLPPVVTHAFMLISDVVSGPALVAIPLILYWCFDKHRAVHVLFSFAFGSVLNGLIKVSACVLRPWMRDSRLRPHEPALETATGYSFPSGHTQTAASIFGALGWSFRDKYRWALPTSVVVVVLVALSRNLLGVHTPQDVLAGMALGWLCVWAAERMLIWVEEGENRDMWLTVVACILAVAFSVFVAIKPYPDDLGLSEDALEDMVLDTYKAIGLFAGAFLGWWAERRYVNFDAPSQRRQGVVRILVGVVLVVAFRYGVAWPFSLLDSDAVFEFAKNFLTTIAAVIVTPWVFVEIERRWPASRQ